MSLSFRFMEQYLIKTSSQPSEALISDDDLGPLFVPEKGKGKAKAKLIGDVYDAYQILSMKRDERDIADGGN
ncbi:hypothetical protein E4U31_004805 [Claviceps sp. LM219 group G6]|nr:hypothetical protein E4U15_002827 [Claviceps sp. LM218 group G6]KAG6098177.1 hypothetical protein E4U31_004805 [Claviceps sp. LM219 group G6]